MAGNGSEGSRHDDSWGSGGGWCGSDEGSEIGWLSMALLTCCCTEMHIG